VPDSTGADEAPALELDAFWPAAWACMCAEFSIQQFGLPCHETDATQRVVHKPFYYLLFYACRLPGRNTQVSQAKKGNLQSFGKTPGISAPKTSLRARVAQKIVHNRRLNF
jgi:hypothetical protein